MIEVCLFNVVSIDDICVPSIQGIIKSYSWGLSWGHFQRARFRWIVGGHDIILCESYCVGCSLWTFILFFLKTCVLLSLNWHYTATRYYGGSGLFCEDEGCWWNITPNASSICHWKASCKKHLNILWQAVYVDMFYMSAVNDATMSISNTTHYLWRCNKITILIWNGVCPLWMLK
mgnify:CR=1 FL=1